ncbi:MAG: hypothetical protein LR001_07125 [Clostridiales bacterium]|nr:hypothetical protein [Clostridiales bacterium]
MNKLKKDITSLMGENFSLVLESKVNDKTIHIDSHDSYNPASIIKVTLC